MNGKQRIVLLAAILIMALMGLFPPWVQTVNVKGLKIEQPGSYNLIFNPPAPDPTLFSGNWKNLIGVHLDVSRLLIQWSVVLILACAICLFIEQECGVFSFWKGIKRKLVLWHNQINEWLGPPKP